MKIAVPREVAASERRVALIPESVKKLVQAGLTVVVEAGAGDNAYFPDPQYQDAGAQIERDTAALLGAADFVLKVQPPMAHPRVGRHEVELMREGAMLLCPIYPTRNLELVRKLVERRITAFATDAIPRTTKAQVMDTLSSQATAAGYKAVLIGAMECGRFFPMLMTAAGTILPAKVLVIGAGVAGLQAIATARRLGATVEAFDTRPAVKEQVLSLGARFVDLGTSQEAQDAGGYARALSEETHRREVELIAQHAASADIVITTALIGGVKAPKLLPEDTVRRMRAGSVIVDLAAEAGGNCTLTEPGQTVVRHGVKICAPLNLPSTMPIHSSQMFSRNLAAFVLEYTKDKTFKLNLDDEIQKGALVTHQGQVLHAGAREALQAAPAAATMGVPA